MRPAGELEGQATESASRFAIDELRLGSYLEAQGFGLKGLRRIRKFSTGQSNPTFRLDAASGSYVLRSKPSGRLIRSAHMIEREFRVLRALAATDVPVPRVHHYCEDAAVMGAPFYVMDFVEGRVYNDATLPEVDPGARRAMYRSALATLVRIHSVDLGAVGMSDFGRHGGYYARQVKRLAAVTEQQVNEAVQPLPHLATVLEWSRVNLPRDRVTLVHGDYKFDNLLFHPSEPRVVAVLDWEMSTIGHPLSDVANWCMFFHLPQDSPLPSLRAPVAGIPREEQLLHWYAAGREMEPVRAREWLFAVAFAFFRMAVILQGVAFRASRGQASSARAAMVGGYAAQLARGSWRAMMRGSLDGLGEQEGEGDGEEGELGGSGEGEGGKGTEGGVAPVGGGCARL